MYYNMLNFIPEEEIRNDLKILNGDAHIIVNMKIKREIGTKYGLTPAECSKTNPIIRRIYEYLRDIRKSKTSFTQEDIFDFYQLTNENSKYDKLAPLLMLETGIFIKYMIQHQYNYLLSKGIRRYTLDNISNITIGRDITGGSMSIKFWLERYKSIKKYYDEYYGDKQKETQIKSKNSSDLFEKLIGETYDIRIELEQHLEDFILKCYDTYIYNDTDYKRIKTLMTEYQDLMHQKNPRYSPAFVPDKEYIKAKKYYDELHFLAQTYRFFNEGEWGFAGKTREQVIEKSINHFNDCFDKLIEKNIIKTLVSANISSDEISIGELENTNFGYRFIITHINGALYVNFIILPENLNYENMDEFISHPQHVHIVNYQCIDYEMKVTKKPLKNILKESFDFNISESSSINLTIDDSDFDYNWNTDATSDIIDKSGNLEDNVKFWKQFVDLGLPSGTLWHKYNIGVDENNLSNRKNWNGNYFAWGETKDKSSNIIGRSYVWTTYKHCRGANNMLKKYITNPDYAAKNPENNYHKYLDNLTTLEPCDDIVTLTFGENFHIPTFEQFDELIKNTTIKWVNDYNGVKNLNGRVFISNINGNEIFIPAAGIMKETNIESLCEEGDIWTSSLDESNNSLAWAFHFKRGSYFLSKEPRYIGYPIRPVYNK